MANSAVIIAEQTDQRREIAQCISPLGFFDHLHFCASLHETRFLLEQYQPKMIFCESGSVEDESLRISAALASLAKRHSCPLVFFSSSEPLELLQLGILPPGSHCLNKQIPNEELKTILQALLNQQQPSTSSNQLSPLSQRHHNTIPGVHSRFSFNNFLHQERSRSQLTGRPFSMLLIEPQAHTDTPQQISQWENLLPAIAVKIKELIRNCDLLCNLEQQQLAILLPETSTTSAGLVVDRIQSSLSEMISGYPFKCLVALASLNSAQNQRSITTTTDKV